MHRRPGGGPRRCRSDPVRRCELGPRVRVLYAHPYPPPVANHDRARDECRDEAYSVPQLFDFIDRNGLTVGRWHWQAPYLPQCGAVATTPHANRLATLTKQEQFAALELWRGTMTTHSAVVYRRDTNDSDVRVALR